MARSSPWHKRVGYFTTPRCTPRTTTTSSRKKQKTPAVLPFGVEYRGRYTAPNPLPAADLLGYFYYAYAYTYEQHRVQPRG
jgi:hypothetical protein